MPKIIDNIREKLLEEAKRQVFENGYSAMTIRSVASACKVGVGTVYNYFPSKDMLIASFMLVDWQECLDYIIDVSNKSNHVEEVLHAIYDQITIFSNKYRKLFEDENAENSYVTSNSFRHKMLRIQIAKPLEKFCTGDNKTFMAEFIAESMLTWTYSKYSYEDIKDLILKLF